MKICIGEFFFLASILSCYFSRHILVHFSMADKLDV